MYNLYFDKLYIRTTFQSTLLTNIQVVYTGQHSHSGNSPTISTDIQQAAHISGDYNPANWACYKRENRRNRMTQIESIVPCSHRELRHFYKLFMSHHWLKFARIFERHTPTNTWSSACLSPQSSRISRHLSLTLTPAKKKGIAYNAQPYWTVPLIRII